MNSKILLSLATIAAVGAIAVGGTTAIFSDTETSTGNTISAGTLDLSVNGQNPLSSKFTISNAKPGDNATTTIAVANVGSIDGSLTVALKNIVNAEGTDTEPELAITDRSIETRGGDLCRNVNITLAEGTTTYYHGALLNATSTIAVGTLNASTTKDFIVGYSIPSEVGNEIQGDSCTFAIEVGLQQ